MAIQKLRPPSNAIFLTHSFIQAIICADWYFLDFTLPSWFCFKNEKKPPSFNLYLFEIIICVIWALCTNVHVASTHLLHCKNHRLMSQLFMRHQPNLKAERLVQLKKSTLVVDAHERTDRRAVLLGEGAGGGGRQNQLLCYSYKYRPNLISSQTSILILESCLAAAFCCLNKNDVDVHPPRRSVVWLVS